METILSSSSQHKVGCVLRGNVLNALIAEFWSVDIREKVLSRSEQNRGDGKVHLIDEAGAKILPDRGDSASEAYVSTASRFSGSLKRRVDAVGDKMKRRAARHNDRFARMVGEHEDRRVVGRVIAPPSLPGVIGPRSSDRAEHIAAQDPRTNIVKSVRRKFVVRTRGATIFSMHSAKRPGSESPFVQGHTTHTKRMLEVLVGTCAIAVD